jgi:ATP-dependent RNA/DNA helicase IGHMBP2
MTNKFLNNRSELNNLLNKSLEGLNAEREHERKHFQEWVLRMPLNERKKEGYSWYPLEIQKKGYTIGGRAFIIFNRVNELGKAHKFRSGNTVRLFTQYASAKKAEQNGVIHFVEKDKMKVILSAKDHPEWIDKGMCGIDLGFEERSYIEMTKAHKLVAEAEKNRLAEIRDILLGFKSQSSSVSSSLKIEKLNQSQNNALSDLVSDKIVSIIHGPPGTGKTTTIVEAVRELTKKMNNLLLCAPSNTAVDLLTERLAAEGISVLRIGNISRVNEELLMHTLEAKLGTHPESKTLKKIRKDAAEARRKAKRFKRNFDRDAYLERKSLFQEAGELETWANQLERRLVEQIISSSQVICCTLVGANDRVLENMEFPMCIIDEAAQALMPSCWIPIAKSSKAALVGDPYQLPPTVKSDQARKLKFERTLLEYAIDRMGQSNLLNIQYRMNEKIMHFSNSQFYSGALQAAETVANKKLKISENQPLQFIDTAGCGFEEKVNPSSKSRYNPEEFLIIREHLLQLIEACKTEGDQTDIAIISPYKEQVMHITDTLNEDTELAEHKITVSTIDGYQGQEKDVVYLSLVRCNEKGDIGFLRDYRRMNVAMTRAKRMLVMVGDSGTISQDRFYSKFLEFVDTENAYRSAWEFMQ